MKELLNSQVQVSELISDDNICKKTEIEYLKQEIIYLKEKDKVDKLKEVLKDLNDKSDNNWTRINLIKI